MNKKIMILFAIIFLMIVGAVVFVLYDTKKLPGSTTILPVDKVVYKNTDYGFNFSLPVSWQGYSVVKETWKGNMLTKTKETTQCYFD